MTFLAWLSELFEISIALDGHLNCFNTETINLHYLTGKDVARKRSLHEFFIRATKTSR